MPRAGHFALILLALSPYYALAALNIQGVSISGNGESEDRPANEEDSNPVVLKCDITGIWSSCKWVHNFMRDELSDIEEHFYCAISPGGGSTNCNPQEVDTGYKKRIKIEEKTSSCELRITNPNYKDSGTWDCVVYSGPDVSYVQDSLDIFVSRQAEVFISEPDLESGGNQYIVFDMQDRLPKIYSKCRAYNTLPPPEFRWYVNEIGPRNEITGPDVQMSEPRKKKAGSRGEYYEHSLDWSPKELCRNYNIDPALCEHEEFEFDLLCVIDQAEYYTTFNEDNVQRVMVRVVGNSGMALTALFLPVITLSYLLSYLN